MKIAETKQYTFALDLLKQLKSSNYEAYFVGGCVRDWILGEEPKDIDIATNAHPQQIKQVFIDKGYTVLEVGEKFGVIVIVSDGIQIEIATYRKDGTYSDGRTPDSVEFSTIEEDAKRRDFTMNGIYYDPTCEKIIDLVGGVEDIRRRVIRTIGNPHDRFSEDYLRMLRAVRFSVQKRYSTLSTETIEAIQTLAPNIRKISMERIKSEVDKIIEHEYDSYRGLTQLKNYGLLDYIYDKPFLPNLHYSIINLLRYHNTSVVAKYVLFFLNLENPEEVDYEYLNRLKFDTTTSKSIIWLMKAVLKFKDNFELLLDEEYMFGSVKSMEYLQHPEFDNLYAILCEMYQHAIYNGGQFGRVKERDCEKEYNHLKNDKELWKQIQKFTIVNGNDMLELGYVGSQIKDILLECKSMYILGRQTKDILYHNISIGRLKGIGREELLDFASRNSPLRAS